MPLTANLYPCVSNVPIPTFPLTDKSFISVAIVLGTYPILSPPRGPTIMAE